MLATASLVAVAALAQIAPLRRIAIDVEVAPESTENDAEALVVAEEIEKSIAYLLNVELVYPNLKLRGCGSDVACMARRLTPASIELVLAVVVNRAVSPALLTMQLIDVKRATVAGDRFDELSGDSALLIRTRAREMFERVGLESGGRLIVETVPTDASIWVGAVAGKSGNALLLAPGNAVLSATREGYDAASAAAEVRRGEDTRVALELKKSASITDSPWLWIAGGAALIVAGTIAAIVIVRSTDDSLMICVYRDPPGSGPCD